MKRSLPIFLPVVMVIIVLFGIMNLSNAENIVGIDAKNGVKDEPIDKPEYDTVIASAVEMGNSENSYIVKEGDSLYLIAQRYGTTVNALKRDNGLKSDLIFSGQELIVSKESVDGTKSDKIWKDDIKSDEVRIVINKTQQKLAIYRGDTELKVYRAHFGEGGMGDKEVQGDRKTPEGNFYITEKSILTPADEYLGTRWMRLSYPNIEDAGRGLNQGIIDKATHDSIADAINKGQTPPQRTALGGGVGIHGGDVPEFEDNWTWGCIGLTNEDAEEIYGYVSVGTTVTITR